MNDKMIFGQYYNTTSWIHRLDPRTKFISLFTLMITVFLISNYYILIGVFLFVLLMMATSNIPIGKFLQSFKMMAMLLLFTIFFQIVFNQAGDPLSSFEFDMTLWSAIIIVLLLVGYNFLGKVTKKFRFLTFILVILLAFYVQTLIHTSPLFFQYQITIYEGGVDSALKILFRIINLISLSSLLTLTTKPTDLNNGLESVTKPLKYIGINVSILAMMISIALRFIPTLINEANRILKAQASRGVDFKEGKLQDKIIQIISLLIPMFVIAYKRAEDLANAMEARGYIPGAQRSKINELRYQFSDFLAYTITFILFASTIILKVVYAI